MDRIIIKTDARQDLNLKLVRVAAYARVSTDKEAMLHSLMAQTEYYQRYIRNHNNWILAGIYSDEAISGTKDSREQFNKMLDDCKDGKIDMIITKSISRFARNTVVLLETVRELKSIDVSVFFEEQNLSTCSGEGELVLSFLASFAQAESKSASDNMKWKIRKKFENGELVNLRHLYGYEIDRTGIKIDPEEAAVVRKIFQMYITGEKVGAITEMAQNSGTHPVFSANWSDAIIRNILRDEKYTGDSILQKSYRNNYIEKKEITNKGQLPKYIAEDTHPAIIDKDMYSKAQARMEASIYPHKNKKKTGPFTSKIKCGCCGKNFKRCTSRGKAFFNCSTYLYKGKDDCVGSRLPEDTLYEITKSVLMVNNITTDILDRLIRCITVIDNTLIYEFTNGETVIKIWQPKSRTESWTPEMREIARKREMERRRLNG